VSTIAAPSPRRITWLRRRRALASAWREYRRHTPGMVGLAILVLAGAMALSAPLLADEAGTHAINTTQNPAWANPSEFSPLGTDGLGRDVMTQFIWGSRISLLVGLAATLLAMVIGSVVGIVAGYFGGAFGGVLMRLTEWFLVIPFLPLAIVLAAILGPSVQNIILVIGITSWPFPARLIRAQVLTVRERDYVDRSRALGCRSSGWAIRPACRGAGCWTTPSRAARSRSRRGGTSSRRGSA
jgi:peptide/nickel transport system permease protein